MHTLERNKEPMYYAKLLRTDTVYDSDGYETGEPQEVYDTPVKVWVHTQPVDSDLEVQRFGIESSGTLWVLMEKQDFTFDESSILWFNAEPPAKPTHRVAGIMPGLNQVVIYAKEL